jgi:hypothetical protein
MAKRRRRLELIEADKFRASALSLLRVRHADWDPYEREFLDDQVKRPDDYIYTDNQWRFLKRLVSFSKTYNHYAGHTVQELLRIAYSRLLDLDYEDQEFVKKLYGWNATDLKLRQINHLASICRIFEPVGRDALNDAALDELRPDDHAV